jgi:hypothetical protein
MVKVCIMSGSKIITVLIPYCFGSFKNEPLFSFSQNFCMKLQLIIFDIEIFHINCMFFKIICEDTEFQYFYP